MFVSIDPNESESHQKTRIFVEVFFHPSVIDIIFLKDKMSPPTTTANCSSSNTDQDVVIHQIQYLHEK